MPHLESEQELEEFLFKSFGEEWLLPYPGGKIYRQVPLSTYGVVDMVAIDIEYSPIRPIVHVALYELKKGAIDNSAVGQIARYRTACKRLLAEKSQDSKLFDYEITGNLVGSDICSGDTCFLVESIEWLSAHVFELDFANGLSFEDKFGWHRADEDFSEITLPCEIMNEFKSAVKYARRLDRHRRKEEENVILAKQGRYLDFFNVNEGSV